MGPDICQPFNNVIQWDVGSISLEFVLWMTDDHAQPGSTSLVGILSSSAFESLISKFVDESLSKHVRLLVETTLYLNPHGNQTSYVGCDNWWRLHSLAGNRVLQELESALGNASLATASLEKLTALFLVQFATIIAVGYSESRTSSINLDPSIFELPVYQSPKPTGSPPSGPSAQVVLEAKKHLLRILAHHMVYIAERINLLGPQVSRKRIIEGSDCRWNRIAMFHCEEMIPSKDADVETKLFSPCGIQGDILGVHRALPTGTPPRHYHLSRSHTPNPSCRLVGGFSTCVHEQSLNVEPSPMDQILAGCQHKPASPLDEGPQLQCNSISRSDLESIQPTSYSTNGINPSSAIHQPPRSNPPPIAYRHQTHLAFETLAQTDAMCAPFLCPDDDDSSKPNINSEDPSNAASPSTLQPSSQTSTLPTNPSSSPPSQVPPPTHDTDPASICRACKFDTLPFGTLDQDRLCPFCAGLPLGDVGDGGDQVYNSSLATEECNMVILEQGVWQGQGLEQGRGKMVV